MPEQNSLESWSKDDLLEVAKRQKAILWMMLVNLVALFNPYFGLVTGLIQIYFIYKLGRAVRSRAPWVYAILAFLPFISLIGLVILNSKAIRLLKSRGIRIGLMGARMTDFDLLPSDRDISLVRDLS